MVPLGKLECVYGESGLDCFLCVKNDLLGSSCHRDTHVKFQKVCICIGTSVKYRRVLQIGSPYLMAVIQRG